MNDIDLAIVKEKVLKIEKWIDNADINHFPTINRRFNSIEKQIAYWSGGLAVIIVLTGILIKLL